MTINWTKKETGYTERELKQFNEVGDSVEGILLALRENSTKMGLTLFADFSTLDETSEFSIIVSKTLEELITPDAIGQAFRIEYAGDGKSKSGRPYKTFNVWTAEIEEPPF